MLRNSLAYYFLCLSLLHNISNSLHWVKRNPFPSFSLYDAKADNADSTFIFLTCHVGFEKLLKFDILENYPNLKLSFGRPGLVTFKSPKSSAYNGNILNIKYRYLYI